MRPFFAILLVMMLGGCGGGSGVGGSAPAPVKRTDMLYGYFGTLGTQAAETAGHVNVVMAGSWGDWSTAAGRQAVSLQIIAELQEAQARGVRKFIVPVDYLVFDKVPGCTEYCLKSRTGLDELAAFKTQMYALGLGELTVALYPVDEPELHGLSDADLTRTLSAIKAIWSAPLAVIYGDTTTYPGIASYDWIGKDRYGSTAVLSQLPPITGSQRHIVVPGGADPWRDDPAPFLAYAESHPEVVAIIAFEWFDRADGRGIRSNGMAAAYAATGKEVKGG